MQASLTQTRPALAQLTRLAQQMGPPQQQQPQTLTGPGAGMPGLQNQIGEYNCFLNVVVQCLWHCQDFKRQFSSLAQENPDIIQVRTFPQPPSAQQTICSYNGSPYISNTVRRSLQSAMEPPGHQVGVSVSPQCEICEGSP